MDDACRIAIVGASARAAASSALQSGFDVVTADRFADEDLRRRCPATRIEDYPEGLADWLAAQEVDGWMYTGGLENHPDLVDRMATIRPLWGNGGEVLRRVRDPFELQRVCREQGVLFPETQKSPDSLPLDGTWLGKTYRGAGGNGVWTLDGPESHARAIAAQAVYQRRIQGVSGSAVFLAQGRHRNRLVNVTRQLVGDKQFSASKWEYCGSISDSQWRLQHGSQINRLGAVFAEQFNLVGLFGVDFVVDKNQLWVVEINPRFPASAEVVEGKQDAVIGHAIACGGAGPGKSNVLSRSIAGKAILFASKSTRISESFVRWALGQEDTLADIPAAGTVIEAGQPVLTVLGSGPSRGVYDRLLDSTTQVKQQLE